MTDAPDSHTADEQANPRSTNPSTQGALDGLVTSVATLLMDTSSENVNKALNETLKITTEFFSMDTAFLRSNDREREVSVLMCEWPVRENVPVPDPLGEVPYSADPVFGATRDLAEPFVMRQTPPTDDYQNRIKTGSGVDGVAMAMTPLVRNNITVGVLGFIKFGDREWATAELNALQAISSLIVQLLGRIDAEERLHFSAYHDDLTGLPNRRSLIERLDDRIATTQTPIGLFFVGVDRFKSVTSFLGQAAGDHVLQVVAARLEALTRTGDIVARLSGDEFIMVFDGVEDEAATATIANRVLEALAEPIAIGEHPIVRTASLGIAISDPAAATSDELLRKADAAFRQAKAAGGNQARFFDLALREAEERRAETEIGLRRAISSGELRLHYQPEIDINTGDLKGLEALVRWQHPTRGLLAAGQFIGVAEETGLVVDLGRWVIAEAIRQMAEWLTRVDHDDFIIRVNLSPAQLSTLDTVDFVADRLSEHGLPGRRLCFEITEHTLMQNPQESIAQLNHLRGLGITLAIDDFGTGYSSMTQLKNLPLDILKIDQTFVAGLGASSGDRAIIEASIHLARSFNLDIVAEGIETVEMLEHLRELGCDRGQGYLLCRPAAPADLEELVASGRLDLSQFATSTEGEAGHNGQTDQLAARSAATTSAGSARFR